MWTDVDCVTRYEECPWQILDGKTFILMPEKSMAHELNTTGTWIWEKLSCKISVAELIDEFCGTFRTTPELVRKDILKLLADLERQGLVVRKGTGLV